MIACGLALGLALLALIFGEQLLRLFRSRRASSSSALMRAARWSSASISFLWHADIDQHADEEHEGDGDPEFRLFEHVHRRLLALQRVGDRGFDRACRRRRADQPLDDRGGGIDRDAAHVGHRGGLGRGDRLLGLGELAR